MEQCVTHTAQVDAKLHRVIAKNFSPGIREVDIRFRPSPGQAGGESDQERISAIESVNSDADDAASDGVAEIDSGNAQSIRGIGAEVGVVGFIVIPGDASPKLSNQRIRKEVVVVQTDAVGVLNA